MAIHNLGDSDPPTNIFSLGALEIILLPNWRPGEGVLPDGSVAVFPSEGQSPSAQLLGPGMGGGIALAKIAKPTQSLESTMNRLYHELRSSKTPFHKLGGPEDFISFYEIVTSTEQGLSPGENLVLINAGCGPAGQAAYKNALRGDDFLRAHEESILLGNLRRNALLKLVEDCSNQSVTQILDLPHTFLERDNGAYIYRREAIRVAPKELGLIIGRLGDFSHLVRVTKDVIRTYNTLPCSTGLKLSFRDAFKTPPPETDPDIGVYIPHFLYQDEFVASNIDLYRTWDEISAKLSPYCLETGLLKPKAYVE